jgi:glycosyltransferase involved in cell wall biosynthesis
VLPACDQADAEQELRVRLENHLPESLPVGSATAMFCYGHCFHRDQRVADLELALDGTVHRPAATGMPRRDLFEWLHGPADPAGHSYRSGFWAVIPVPAPHEPGEIVLRALVRLDSGAELVRELGRIEVAHGVSSSVAPDPGTSELIAVCMATFDPDPVLLRVQLDSLRAQTDDRWMCVISDGGSAPARFDQLRALVGDDRRFTISRSARLLGVYRNFERALTMVPAATQLIALCDQDDYWYQDKLAVMREAIGSAGLVYSDQRLVSDDGTVLRNSLWHGRRNEHENLASMLVANTVAGAAMLFRRRVADLALPFPDTPGVQYHDHWLALVALAAGEIRYVDRPLYDYVQHGAAVQGELVGGDWERCARSASRGWRAAYFCGLIPRQQQAETLLLRCSGMLSARKRRALRWFVGSSRSPIWFAWLALRPLRVVFGRGETLGEERALARGILWRWLIVAVTRRAQRPGRRAADASFPNPPQFEQPRLRRWRASG